MPNQYCADHPKEISKLSKVKAQVSKVKGVMMENIEKVHTSYRILHAIGRLVEILWHACFPVNM